jgi:NAD(P)-dependent dehydrogenase (short-subunit alcohol dehydrogenase family)
MAENQIILNQIIVTGASRGIGAAIALDLARRGFAVACLSRSGATPAGSGIAGTGPTCTGIACDVCDEAAVAAAIKLVAERGPIVGVVNCAGAHAAAPSATLPIAAFDRAIRLNTTATLVVCQQAYPHLVAAGEALIVNIGSFFDRLAVPENVAYCASKAAVAAIGRCLAAEWAKDGIRVMTIAPGYIETDLNRAWLAQDQVRAWVGRRIPVGRPGQPEEVARLVGALFAEKIGFLTGETIYLDGGQGINH